MIESAARSRICVCLVVCSAFAFSAESSPSEPTRMEITNKFNILLANDGQGVLTDRVLEELSQGRLDQSPIAAIREFYPVGFGRYLNPLPRVKPEEREETAREKLGRYIVLQFDPEMDSRQIIEALSQDPNVQAFSQSSNFSTSGSLPSFAPPPFVTENQTWGFDAVAAGEAHEYQTGHALVGVADYGLREDHPEFMDFIGYTWKKGNFHPSSSFTLGRGLSVSGSGANPYAGPAALGSVDEYHMTVRVGDEVCDDINSNGTFEDERVGHGNHVTGIVGANGYDTNDMTGICFSCPLVIGQFKYPNLCAADSAPLVTHAQGIIEGRSASSPETAFGAIAFAIDAGSQVVNLSGGIKFVTGLGHQIPNDNDYCDYNLNTHEFESQLPECLVVQYALDRDVVFVAAGGNHNRGDGLDFPASDRRVIGVGGSQSDGSRWVADRQNHNHFGAEHGSNRLAGATDDTASFTFLGPAKDIYSTMWSEKTYYPAIRSSEFTDGVYDDYGYMTGTSMAAPFVTGVAALVRSTNPLASSGQVKDLLIETSSKATYSEWKGWGTPKADDAVLGMLGTSNSTQVLNRTTPLFAMYSEEAEDVAHTTKPQVVAAYSINSTWHYVPQSSTWVEAVDGFTVSESPEASPSQVGQLKADIHLLTTHRTPIPGKTLTPLYRMSWVSSGPSTNADWSLFLESEMSGNFGYKSVGYELNGKSGYIFEICSPEPSCIPLDAVPIYRAYNSVLDDHSIFEEQDLPSAQSAGYLTPVKLGYAYRNADFDSDGLVDGMERILGTSPLLIDSDCDGIDDGVEYPATGVPDTDPLDSSCPTILYHIVHEETGRILDSCSTINGTHVQVISAAGASACSEWKLIPTSNGHFYVENNQTNKRLQPSGTSVNDHVVIQPNSWTGGWLQWKVINTDGDNGLIRNLNGGTNMHVYSGGTEPRVRPASWVGPSSKWRITAINN